MTAVNELSQAEYELMQLVLKNEKSWQADVLAFARADGWRAFNETRPKGSPEGWPDLRLVHVEQRRTLFAELKREPIRSQEKDGEGNVIARRHRPTLSWKQRGWLDTHERAGNEEYLWIPSDREEVLQALGPRGMFVTFAGPNNVEMQPNDFNLTARKKFPTHWAHRGRPGALV